jgi:hypothetical protein
MAHIIFKTVGTTGATAGPQGQSDSPGWRSLRAGIVDLRAVCARRERLRMSAESAFGG